MGKDMQGPVDRDYLDARFEGMKELLMYYQQTTTNHIASVSANVKAVGKELQEHKESIDPHGRRATDRLSQNAVAWLGVAMASVLAFVELRKR